MLVVIPLLVVAAILVIPSLFVILAMPADVVSTEVASLLEAAVSLAMAEVVADAVAPPAAPETAVKGVAVPAVQDASPLPTLEKPCSGSPTQQVSPETSKSLLLP